MNIEDILAEWERKKKENLEKREEEVRQHVLQQTGAMFTEFEQAVRDGLLEKLEKEKAADTADTVAEDTTDTDEVEELEEITEEPATEEPVEETDGGCSCRGSGTRACRRASGRGYCRKNSRKNLHMSRKQKNLRNLRNRKQKSMSRKKS